MPTSCWRTGFLARTYIHLFSCDLYPVSLASLTSCWRTGFLARAPPEPRSLSTPASRNWDPLNIEHRFSTKKRTMLLDLNWHSIWRPSMCGLLVCWQRKWKLYQKVFRSPSPGRVNVWQNRAQDFPEKFAIYLENLAHSVFLREGLKKNWQKAVRLTAPPPSLTASICENVEPFLSAK